MIPEGISQETEDARDETSSLRVSDVSEMKIERPPCSREPAGARGGGRGLERAPRGSSNHISAGGGRWCLGGSADAQAGGPPSRAAARRASARRSLCAGPSATERGRRGTALEKWSRAERPHDGSQPSEPRCSLSLMWCRPPRKAGIRRTHQENASECRNFSELKSVSRAGSPANTQDSGPE